MTMVQITPFNSITAVSINFESSSYRISEGEQKAMLMLMLSNPSSPSINIKVSTNDVNATGTCSLVELLLLLYPHYGIIGGVDYVSGPYPVTFTAGVTKVSLDVDIINDIVLEGDEVFQLSIDSITPPNHRVTVNNPSVVNVTIVDNDRKLLFIISYL